MRMHYLLAAALFIFIALSEGHAGQTTPPLRGGGTNRLIAPRITGHIPTGTFFFVQTNQDGSLSVMDNQATLARMQQGTNGVDLSVFTNQVRMMNTQQPVIRTNADGAIGDGGGMTVRFGANILDSDAIRISCIGGQVLRGRIAGIAISDGNHTQWLGYVQESIGQIVAPNQVLWTNAIGGLGQYRKIEVDVLATYTLVSFEYDIIFRNGFDLPQNPNFDPKTSRIQVVTEWFDTPVPRQKTHPIALRVDPKALADLGPLNDVDGDLDFGAARTKMIQGRAFLTTPKPGEKTSGAADIPVAKTWIRQPQGQGKPDRQFLVEFSDFLSIKPALDTLEPMKTASLGPVEDNNPFQAHIGTSLLDYATMLVTSRESPTPPYLLPSPFVYPNSQLPQPQPLTFASLPGLEAPSPHPLNRPGVTIDYILVNNALLNVNLGDWSTGTKVGPAVVGHGTNDFWNDCYEQTFGVYWSDYSWSDIEVTAQNIDTAYYNSTGDPMFDSYLFNWGDYDENETFYPGWLGVSFYNVPVGFYDIYIYGHGSGANEYSVFSLCDCWHIFNASTGIGPYGANPIGTNWTEYGHYVVFHGVRVRQDEGLGITVQANEEGNAIINGVQLFATVGNSAPAVNAGDDQHISGLSTYLIGSVIDDGLPGGGVLTTWSKVSGPGAVSFTHSNWAATMVNFGSPGVYSLRLTADDGQYSAFDDVVVTVNTPPAISAVPTQYSFNGAPFSPISITIGDAETPATNLTLQVLYSSNPAWLSTNYITLSGSGSNRTVTINPTPIISGYVTLRVSDGIDYADCTFMAVVWTGGGNQLIDKPLLNINFGNGTKTGLAAVGRATNDFWNQYITGGYYTNLYWSDHTASGITLGFGYTGAPGTNATGDAMFDSYLPNCEVALNQLVPGIYDLYLYGHGLADSANSLFSLPDYSLGPYATGIGPFGTYQVGTNWLAGGHYVVFRNLMVMQYHPYLNILFSPNEQGGAYLNGLQLVKQAGNSPPTVYAGPNQALNFNEYEPVQLTGAVTDDGLPNGPLLAICWSKVSGPGAVYFDDESLTNTLAYFSQGGIYTLRLTAGDSQLVSSNDVVISLNVPPTITLSNVPIIPFTATNLINLNATVSDDGLPAGGTVTHFWSGPAGVVFGNTNSLNTTVHIPWPGFTFLTLTASDGQLTNSANISIGLNSPPVIAGLVNQTNYMPNNTWLNASVSDDGMPGYPLTCQWSKASGPGTVQFGNALSSYTSVTFSAPGLYDLRLIVSDTQLSATNDVIIIASNTVYISNIPYQMIPISSDTGPIQFVATSTITPATNLTLQAVSSSNPNLVPLSNSNIVIQSNGPYRTVKVTPTPGLSGTSRITIWVSDNIGSATKMFEVTAGEVTPGAAFRFNDYSSGSWMGRYGMDGYKIVGWNWNGNTNYPPYVQVSDNSSGPCWWADPSSDVRALQIPGSTNRVAYFDYANGSLIYNLNFRDSFWHAVEFYALDWDSANRAERLEVWDGAGTNLLASKEVLYFNTGEYLDWWLKGSVQVRVIATAGPYPVMSGLFFDPAMESHWPPVIANLTNQTVNYPNPVNLSASVTHDDTSNLGLYYSWGLYSGPSWVNFLPSNTTNTTASFGAPGVYTLYLAAGDSYGITYKYVTITVHTDNDSDGLPDSWEYQYFGDLSQGANDDFNGDGITNLQHYQNHSDPTALRIEITQPPPAGNLP